MLKRILGILLSGTLVVSCANIAAPNGGPPDTTPPTVLETSPKQKALNFSDDHVTIEWSKYMDRAKVIENLSIMPTVKYSYDWSGKDLQIDFEEPLRENTSYSILFGTGLHRQQAKQASGSFFLDILNGQRFGFWRDSRNIARCTTGRKLCFCLRLGRDQSRHIKSFRHCAKL